MNDKWSKFLDAIADQAAQYDIVLEGASYSETNCSFQMRHKIVDDKEWEQERKGASQEKTRGVRSDSSAWTITIEDAPPYLIPGKTPYDPTFILMVKITHLTVPKDEDPIVSETYSLAEPRYVFAILYAA